MLGVFIGSAALIIILSAFNGLENLVISLSNNLNPDLRIEPTIGKTFDPENSVFIDFKKANLSVIYTEVLQEKALLKYRSQQFIGQIKGVSNDFLKNKNLDPMLKQGSFVLQQNEQDYAVVGAQVQYALGITINDPLSVLEIYSPNKKTSTGINPAEEFTSRYLQPIGVFESNQESDQYVIIPINTARALLAEPKNISAAEITFKNPADIDESKTWLQKNLGKNFIVKDRIQQNALLYKILNSEKWAVYLILTFVLLIATFNIIGSLTMLVIDKQKDIAILNSLGANKILIQSIFLFEGLMISFIGCILGLIFGGLFALFQQKYGFISMGDTNLVANAYPMAIKIVDFLLIFGTVFIISFVASFFSAKLSIKRFEQLKQAF